MNKETVHLTDRFPRAAGHELVAELAPPPQFANATFDSYKPDPNHPSQQESVETLRQFIAPPIAAPKSGGFFGAFKKKAAPVLVSPLAGKMGVYLDGGFGVGKTHLLAAAWHAQPGQKYFGTFIEYTALVGALGYEGAINALRGAKLICIDEFELDDPGDTMLMTRMIKDLTNTGSKFIATSNTPPNALGEGRFAAADFMREIQAMSDRFHTIRIDGEDYRQRNVTGDARVLDSAAYDSAIKTAQDAAHTVSDDAFQDLLNHLKQVHPSNYALLLRDLGLIGLRDVHELTDQSEALRFVAFIDRVYDAQIPLIATGIPLSQIFGGGMIDGGYRKKYLRCISRANALTHETLPGAPEV